MAGFPRSTYYDSRYHQSPALIRARRPFIVKTSLTGVGLVAFIVGVYSYTIHAVGQENFEDVKVPDVPTKPGSATTSESARK